MNLVDIASSSRIRRKQWTMPLRWALECLECNDTVIQQTEDGKPVDLLIFIGMWPYQNKEGKVGSSSSSPVDIAVARLKKMSQAALCREAHGTQRHHWWTRDEGGNFGELWHVWGATEWSNLPGTWKMMIEEWFRNIKVTQEWHFAKFAWWILPDHHSLIYPGPKSGIWMSLIW